MGRTVTNITDPSPLKKMTAIQLLKVLLLSKTRTGDSKTKKTWQYIPPTDQSSQTLPTDWLSARLRLGGKTTIHLN